MALQPMPLSRKALPFDHPEWIFELKYDGFRSLAVIQNGHTQLISRNGHRFNSFSDLSTSLAPYFAEKTVLDGEIVCLDKQGRPQFRDLLFHRTEPCFYASKLGIKKTYIPPSLLEYGNIAKLTQGGAGTGSDGGTGTMMIMCL